MSHTVRGALIRTLRRLDRPLDWGDLTACVTGSSEVPAVPEIVSEEKAAWGEGEERKHWLCPALTETKGVMSTEYLTLSSWKPAHRIVPTSALLFELWMVRVFCDEYLSVEEEGGGNLQAIRGGSCIMAPELRIASPKSCPLSIELTLLIPS